MKTANGKLILDKVPPFERPVWDGLKVLNKGEKPLWSGKGEPPAVGSYVDIAGPRNEVATVLGYYIDDGWLMLWGERHSDGKIGNLAGTEIRWPD